MYTAISKHHTMDFKTIFECQNYMNSTTQNVSFAHKSVIQNNCTILGSILLKFSLQPTCIYTYINYVSVKMSTKLK